MTGASSISTRKNMRPAAQANDERWGGCRGTYEGETFEEGVERLKEFMRLRLEWMDEQFASVEMLRLSLGGYVVSESDLGGTDRHRSAGGKDAGRNPL